MKIVNPTFFIGYDSREDIAYRVCKQSLLKYASIDLNIIALKLYELISKGFYLQTNILDDYNKYYIDIGGRAWAKDNHKYGKVVGHVKNLLPFLGGSNPIWKQKRSYQRHNVRRGIHLG